MQFNPQNLQLLRADIQAALDAVASKHGISLSMGKITYESDTFRAQLTAVGAKSEDGSTLSKEALEFTKYAELIGFKKEHLGAEFRMGGKTFKIAGFRPRTKKSIIGEYNGKQYIFTAEDVKRLMGI